MAPLPTMSEAATPLYFFACLLSDEDPLNQTMALSALILVAIEWIKYVDYMAHIQECQSCAARYQLQNFIAERTF